MSKYPLKVGVCKYCSGDIIAKNSSFNKPNRIFCSKTCRTIWENKNIPYSEARRKKLSERAKILFTGIKNSPETIEKKRLANIGSKSHFWKGGLTDLKRRLRSCSKYRFWRKSVFERDNYTCQECGIRGGILNADHIKPFSIIMENYKITTFIDGINCIEMWNINNGKTLCLDCHKNTPTFAYKLLYQSQ